jgi:dihydroneopterin aldolase
MTDCITLCDLEVHYRVGVPDEERQKPQRLLLTVQVFRDFNAAIQTDSIDTTTNYFAISERLKRLGDHREWKLIEKLAGDIAALILAEFPCERVAVEVKKFIIPETRHVSVRLERSRPLHA